jgi:hypothetical protein
VQSSQKYVKTDTPRPLSGGLHHKAGPNAAGTRTNSFNGPVRADMPYLLEIGIPDALGLVICVADVISDMGCLPAELTNSAHNQCFLSVYFELESQLTLTKDNLYRINPEMARSKNPLFHIPSFLLSP